MKSLKDFFIKYDFVASDELEKYDGLLNGIEVWIYNELLPGVQDWVIEEFAPEVENWVINEYSPALEKWLRKIFRKKINFKNKENKKSLQDFLKDEEE